MTNKRKTHSASSIDEGTRELDALRARIQELEGEQTDSKIPLDDLISVMSLIPYTLNLSTKERGQGKTIKLERFGQIKRVLYKDLLDILEVNRRFTEAGYFLILDRRVLKAHGLEEIYLQILTKDKIESVLNGSDDCTDLYLSCNPAQQEILVSMLVEKLRDNPDTVDLNMIDKISRVSKVNIQEKAKDARFLMGKNSETEED